ncbi:MAG: glycosyltransferase family 4 protein [Planctomycetota bacterium]
MRVLFLTHYFPPEGNAPATRVHQFCRRWVDAGHDVTVITCAPNVPTGKVYDGYRNRLWQREQVDGIEVIRVWTLLAANAGTFKRILNYATYMLSAVLAAALRRSPDVVIATSPQMFCGVAGALLRVLRRWTFVLEVRDLWPESIATVGAMKKSLLLRGLERLERWMYRRAQRIVAVGDGYKRKLVERGVPDDKIAVVTNGVDPATFAAAQPDADLRAQHGWVGKTTFAYIGTVGMAAGLDVVPRAAARLRARGREDIHFVVVGDGAEWDALAQRAEEQAAGMVTFTGLLPKRRMPAVLATVDVCLVHLRAAPLFETVLPSKMFEAAATGRPILLGVAGEAAALLEQTGAGVTFPPEDDEALAAACERLADDPRLRAALGAAGRAQMTPKFDVDVLARRYLDMLVQLAGARR